MRRYGNLCKYIHILRTSECIFINKYTFLKKILIAKNDSVALARAIWLNLQTKETFFDDTDRLGFVFGKVSIIIIIINLMLKKLPSYLELF